MRSNEYMNEKYLKLKKYLADLGSAAVAFSGGVDSAFLLYAACDALGADKVLAITATAECMLSRESKEAEDFCREIGAAQEKVAIEQLTIEGFAENPENRCYICKYALFSELRKAATDGGYAALVDGTNMDDTGDFRPGMKALAELGIVSPLKDCGIYKKDIREMSKDLGLPTWDKPSFACLASRFPYGERITQQKLYIVEGAEEILRSLGFTQYRVRIHEAGSCGFIASVEVLPEEFDLFERSRDGIEERFMELGFARTDLDPEGYRTGSLNKNAAV